MSATIVQQLSKFTADASFDRLPADVVDESKRIVLDSLGCALAALEEPKGRIGVDFGRMLGAGAKQDATIIGTGERVSTFGAAFANGELINTLDYDIVLPPGHVTPYVLPVVLAVGESAKASGKDILLSTALSHEMSFRFGKAMDNLRDTKDGQVDTPEVLGYSATIFGATAAALKLMGKGEDIIAHGLGIAACTSPVNAQIAWFEHAPSSTIKYLLAGALTQSALTAAHMAALGHRGDIDVLDDRRYGYARFIGTKKWDFEQITDKLGEEWRFPPHLSYKPYPHCRILHALVGCMTNMLQENDIRPDEIESIKVWVEGMVERPVWLNRDVQHVHDAQFSIAHGIAVAAHRPTPGRAWQDPELVFGRSVMALMEKVTHEVHPDYVSLLTSHGASRPAFVEIQARGQTFKAEQRYPKGVKSPDPQSFMTNEELIEKFRENASRGLTQTEIDDIVSDVFNLDHIDNIGTVMRKLVMRRRIASVA